MNLACKHGQLKRSCEICDLEQQLAAKDAEIARLKSVPMKYRRMAFNAQLQNENEQLNQQLAESENLRTGVELGMDCANAEAVRLRKQLVMLRDAIEEGLGTYHVPRTARIMEALASTADLSGCILCDAEPRSYLYKHNSAFGDGIIWSNRPLHNGRDALESLPLYKAKESK